MERADAFRGWITTQQELSQQEQEEIQRNNARKQEIEETYRQKLKEIDENHNLSALERQGAIDKAYDQLMIDMENERQRHADEMDRIQQGMDQDMDESQEEQLGTWIAMLGDTELYGGDISTENQKMVDAILSYYGRLEGDAKDSFKNMLDGAMEGIKEKEPSLFERVGGMVGGVINKIKTSLGIASPSKVMRRIFRYVVEGAEVGMEDEAPNLYKQTEGIAGGVVSRFQKAKLDASALVAKMRAAITSERARISSPMAVTAQYKAMRDSSLYSNDIPNTSEGNYVAEVHVDLDGREVARATAPFMGEQLAWEG